MISDLLQTKLLLLLTTDKMIKTTQIIIYVTMWCTQ